MSCFADWSKCSHVTLIVIIWSTRHGHVTFSSVENVALGLRLRARATFSTSGLSYFSVHSRPCIICKMLAMISVALWHCHNDIPRIRWETSAGVGTPLPPDFCERDVMLVTSGKHLIIMFDALTRKFLTTHRVVMSQRLWSRYDRHFAGTTWYNALS